MNARIVPIETKAKKSKELAEHRMTISASVAKDGLPKYWGIPNAESIASIEEAINDIKDPHLAEVSAYDELKKLLDE